METLRRPGPVLSTVGRPASARSGSERFIGIDLGAETVKLLELLRDEDGLRVGRRLILEHQKKPGPVLREALEQWDWARAAGAAVSGRFADRLNLPRIPTKQAQLRGYRFFFGLEPATIVNIGSHGFSVLEVRSPELTVFRENSRCSQGTGNFLRQLVERFCLTVEEASTLCADVPDPALLSGRCPVILKTDVTHLANKGEDRARILAGLFDAVCQNALLLIRPGLSPTRVLLVGGVSRSQRVRRAFGQALARQEMQLLDLGQDESLCLEALGCALVATESPGELPALDELLLPPHEMKVERLPALADALAKVRRMPPRPWAQLNGEVRRLILGFDIGSTGSKLVALDAASQEIVREDYRQTLGDPVGAAQDLLRRFLASLPTSRDCPIIAFGVTGSGREVAGSLLTSCFGKDAVFIVNEIVAHAAGALYYDPRVDTIFEIGGQDAKYIRLADGHLFDCAMNEACSAGTGSFIEEQGGKFAGIRDVCHLGCAALDAPWGVSLGQHCSVFMAEVIDEAVAAGVEQPAILSGLYDSVIKNYLNRVKGTRSVGNVIFCQGMPFSADALAAAVARQTGSQVIVPPNPGTVGALGIALLAGRELPAASLAPLDPAQFLSAKVEQKDTFVCRANSGCGGGGNRCRIERLRTLVNQQRSSFTWGGGCALHDKATRKKKLPDLAPDPFRQRTELLDQLIAPLLAPRGKPRLALTDEFMLQGLFPFFAVFLHQAGFDLDVVRGADQATLKRGIQLAGVPLCAPMQLFHGLAERLAQTGTDRLFVPMIRSVPRVSGQSSSIVCPMVQASPDLVRCTLENAGCRPQPANEPAAASPQTAQADLRLAAADQARSADFQSAVSQISNLRTPDTSSGSEDSARQPTGSRRYSRLEICATFLQQLRPAKNLRSAPPPRLLSPCIDFGEGGLESPEFKASCRTLARELGLSAAQWRVAWAAGLAAQRKFDAACLELGQRALDFCRSHQIVPVVVLGRSYTIYNKTLNSNVPAILREQGAIGIPADCYPVDPNAPVFRDMYWGYAHNILRAAHQVRRAEGVYALYCSNYSCGPDSFNLHFAAYIMEGKPFAVIETDGHSGDAGTKTRLEAFLHCVEEERRAHSLTRALNDFANAQFSGLSLSDLGRHNGARERILVPYIGPASETVAAVLRGLGLLGESLPAPDSESLRRGRRYTSGKECLPMPLTLGSLLQRLEGARDGERFVYLMPGADGPCRFGVYNLLNQIVLERLGWRDRVRIWSPKDTGYFDTMPAGTEMLLLAGFVASDLLLQAKLDVRPLERVPGATEVLYARCHRELLTRLEAAGKGDLALGPALRQVLGGRLFGLRELLEEAGAEFARLRGPGDLPLVELTGEIYVRAVEFSNDFLIEKLEKRGLRVHLAPKTEWLAYCGYTRAQQPGRNWLADRFSDLVQRRIEAAALAAIAPHLGWPAPPSTAEILATAEPYLSPALEGEAVLTLGASLHGWHHRHIDAVVCVGPLECMPTRIAEAQFQHLAEREGLLTLTLSFNGDPVNMTALDNFAFEVNARFQRNRGRGQPLVRCGASLAPDRT